MIPASPALGADSPALVTLPVMTPDVLFIVPPDWFATLPIILPLLSTVPLFVNVPVTFVVLPLLLVYVEPAVFTFRFVTYGLPGCPTCSFTCFVSRSRRERRMGQYTRSYVIRLSISFARYRSFSFNEET